MTLARLIRNDEGNILITTILVSMIVGMLGALTLTTAEQADRSSASDRNSELALAAAEAGVDQAIATINAQANDTGANAGCPAFPLPETDTPVGGPCWDSPGKYDVDVTKTPKGFIIDSEGENGVGALKRKRHIRITLSPPKLFPPDGRYAIFSYTSVDVKNTSRVLRGDVWANSSVIIRNGTRFSGSVTAAQSWIHLENNAQVDGYAWSGGYKDEAPPGSDSSAEDWAMNLGSGSSIGGWAKTGVLAAGCTPPEELQRYRVKGGAIGGQITTPASVVGTSYSGEVDNSCTASPPIKPLPKFSFNAKLYPSVHGPWTVEQFQDWLDFNKTNFKGAFLVNEPGSPTQDNRIDLTGATLTGNATIVTNAPVFTASMDENNDRKEFVVVSHYAPPVSTGCDVNHDNSECAIHIKNNFDFDATANTCKTAVLMYADRGPTAVKNHDTMCGSVISNGVLIKNGQTLDWDDRLSRALGFGPQTFEIAKWEELPIR